MNKIVVIGANAAGMSFAAKYKRNSPSDQIIVLEQLSKVSFGACGLPYYAQSCFDNKDEMYARSVDEIITSGIDLRINSIVTSVDFEKKQITYSNNEEINKLEYDKLIIATGAKPIALEGITKTDKIQTLVSIEDGEKLRNILLDNNVKHITIIGSGFIGMEVLDAAKHSGKKITLVERGNGVLTKYIESEFQNIVLNKLKENDIDIKLNQSVQTISDDLIIKTDKEEFKTDYVVISVGFRPNTEMFSNINKLANGAIVTDENNKTSIKDVYAIGDCATVIDFTTRKPKYIALATVANKQGRSLADKLAGIDNTFNSMVGSSAVKILDLDVARCGLTTKECIDNNIDFGYKIITDKTHTSYYPNQEDIAICLIYEKQTLKIIGGQIIGKKDVVHRLNTLALAIQKEVTTKELGYIDFAYAPPFSRTWEVLNVAGNVIKK